MKKEIFYPSNGNETHDDHCIVSGVFCLLDNLYHPEDTYYLLAVIRDSYKGDHLEASKSHKICHNELFASWQIYKSMNDFTDFIVKVMKDFNNWDIYEIFGIQHFSMAIAFVKATIMYFGC
jgi:hypothetical protein